MKLLFWCEEEFIVVRETCTLSCWDLTVRQLKDSFMFSVLGLNPGSVSTTAVVGQPQEFLKIDHSHQFNWVLDAG